MLSSYGEGLNAIPFGDFLPSLGSPLSSFFSEKCSSLPLLSPLRTGGGPSSSTSSPLPPPPPPSDAPDLKLDYFHQFPVPLKQLLPRAPSCVGEFVRWGWVGVGWETEARPRREGARFNTYDYPQTLSYPNILLGRQCGNMLNPLCWTSKERQRGEEKGFDECLFPLALLALQHIERIRYQGNTTHAMFTTTVPTASNIKLFYF